MHHYIATVMIPLCIIQVYICSFIFCERAICMWQQKKNASGRSQDRSLFWLRTPTTLQVGSKVEVVAEAVTSVITMKQNVNINA